MSQAVSPLLVVVLLLNLFVLGTSRLRAVIVKGLVIPRLLYKAMRDSAIHREVEPFIGFIPSLFLGAMGTALALLFSGRLPLAPEHEGSLLVPSSLATVITGFLVLTTRRKAITQVVG